LRRASPRRQGCGDSATTFHQKGLFYGCGGAIAALLAKADEIAVRDVLRAGFVEKSQQ
jgi:hypothetical protein